MIDRGHADEALKQLDPMAAQNPVPPGINRLRGIALYSQNHFAEADTAFASALKDDSHDEESRQMRGLTLFRLGKPADAIPLLESAHGWTSDTRVDPSYVLGLCYLDTRNYDVFEYTFVFAVNGETVQIPYPVIVDKRTHEPIVAPQPKEYPLPVLTVTPGAVKA